MARRVGFIPQRPVQEPPEELAQEAPEAAQAAAQGGNNDQADAPEEAESGKKVGGKRARRQNKES